MKGEHWEETRLRECTVSYAISSLVLQECTVRYALSLVLGSVHCELCLNESRSYSQSGAVKSLILHQLPGQAGDTMRPPHTHGGRQDSNRHTPNKIVTNQTRERFRGTFCEWVHLIRFYYRELWCFRRS